MAERVRSLRNRPGVTYRHIKEERAGEPVMVRIAGEFPLWPSEIWPDGDAPENPTLEDVMAAMSRDATGPAELIATWKLGAELSVFVQDDRANWREWRRRPELCLKGRSQPA